MSDRCAGSLINYPRRRPDRWNRRPCRWEYDLHLCVVDFEMEPDNIKAVHLVINRSGHVMYAPLDPYDSGADLVEAWIAQGYPSPASDYLTRSDLGLE